MAQKIVGIIKINGWVKRLTEVLAVCIIVGVCLVGNQIGEQQKEIVISDNTENERYDLGDMDGNGQTEYIEVVNVIKSIGPDIYAFTLMVSLSMNMMILCGYMTLKMQNILIWIMMGRRKYFSVFCHRSIPHRLQST